MSEPAPTPIPILVPVDFSPCSRAALDRALDLGERLGGTVTLFHAVDASGILLGGAEHHVNVAELAARIAEGARADLDRLAAEADPGRRRIARTEVVDGRPAEAIVEAARREGAGLIVMGTRGRTGLPRLLLGSVAERVVRLAPCDVLVVHGPKE